MIFQSLLPPVPDFAFPNAHHLVLNRPDQAEWEDHILHVDALTGKTRKWHEFKDRVKRGATAFRNPDLFPYEENEIVGILSENCVVGYREMTFRVCVLTADACRSIRRLFIPCWPPASHSLCSRHHRLYTS